METRGLGGDAGAVCRSCRIMRGKRPAAGILPGRRRKQAIACGSLVRRTVADPHHREALDSFDRLTVRLYRTGLSLGALSLIGAGCVFGLGADSATAHGVVWGGVALGAALASTSMHLYAKRIRWVIATSTTLGLVVMGLAGGAAGHPVVFHAGLGLVFVAYSAWALKEQFCFRIPGLRLVPLFLAASLVPLLVGPSVAAGVLLALAGLVMAWLSLAKWRMPLTHDIGDKSAYQV